MSPFGCQCVVGSDAVVVAGSLATVYQSIAVQNKIDDKYCPTIIFECDRFIHPQ
jgi:hypothetical protein